MTKEELKNRITTFCPTVTWDETGEFLTTFSPAAQFLSLMKELRSATDLEFDYLFCMTAVDFKDNFTTVYHLTSTPFRHALVVKVQLTDKINPRVDSVAGIWKGANFLEREVYDLMGITFNGHPDLRRLILEDDFVGYPLRKDYTDENMIEL
jgi:NADH-quinone oxidoreductase subunit C